MSTSSKSTEKKAEDGPRIAKAEFSAGAASAKQIPQASAPEIAFAGRSNVGKSSLLNMMLARKGLARTSRTPGCTRQINFFDVGIAGGPELVFVDLPGYGYARVSKSEAQEWKALLESYLTERTTLKGVVILVDIRRGLEREERDLIEFLKHERDLPVVLCATKLDKIPRASHKPALAALGREVAELFADAGESGSSDARVIGTSSSSSLGREELWKRLLWLSSRDPHAPPNSENT